MNLSEIKKHITVSNGNIKLGYVPSISLPPIKSCRKNAPCSKDCYALKSYRLYPSVRKAWNKNLDTYNKDNSFYFECLSSWLKIKQPKFFRFHISGDIPDIEYLERVVITAAGFENIKFLIFTKRYDIVNKYLRYGQTIPGNLSIVFSAWPGLRLNNPYKFPVAYMQDGNEKRVNNAIECPGNCESCGMCWGLKNINKNVVFHKH